MKLEFVPLLRVQRELYDLPRGGERFRAYLNTMLDPVTGEMRLPLGMMNPMGKSHLPRLLDRLLEMEADTVAAEAVAHAGAAMTPRAESEQFRLALVVADDAGGGWTNRFSTEFSHRFETQPLLRRGWIVGLLWSSEQPSPASIRGEVLTSIYRAGHVRRHRPARTLGEMLEQEGEAMARAGCDAPKLDEAELAYTREVIAPHLGARDWPTLFPCLFGDAAARAFGYHPQGLSGRAGLALALDEAKSRCAAV